MGRTDQEVVSAGGKDEDLTPSSASRELEPSHEMEKWILPNWAIEHKPRSLC